MLQIVYSPKYDMGIMGLDRLHPFDVRKFGKAWRLLEQRFGNRLHEWHKSVDRPVSDDELLSVHSPAHLSRMREPAQLAKAFEVPLAAMVPFAILDRGIVQPMRWGVRGSILAAESALAVGLAINLSGGYHHAKPDRAEGFCLFSDVALMVHSLRTQGKLATADSIAYVDLDAHQGNGVCHQFIGDRSVRIFDMFNSEIYPYDEVARDRIDLPVQLESGCSGAEYLSLLRAKLPLFLDQAQSPALAIYNAGTDVVAGDQLGLMSLSPEDVLQRDQLVVAECRRRNIPTAVLLSGGYTELSHRLIAESVAQLCERYGGA